MKKLSIIIVTLNASSDLDKTLKSIFDQSYSDYEIVIIDGQSTDDTLSIIQNFEPRIDYWTSEPDEGIYDAMNKGLAAATGEYVQFLNAGDCFVDGEVLGRVFSEVDHRPTLIYGAINILHTDGRVTRQEPG